jgi:hypothetical protein
LKRKRCGKRKRRIVYALLLSTTERILETSQSVNTHFSPALCSTCLLPSLAISCEPSHVRSKCSSLNVPDLSVAVNGSEEEITCPLAGEPLLCEGKFDDRKTKAGGILEGLSPSIGPRESG